MPRQLIYTSVPRGLTPGQSGYCTVARSRDLREALIPQLEKFSYYTPEAGGNPVICCHRIVEVRGARFHVLSRIVDAEFDFTRRRRFIAHHLIFEPAEIETATFPAQIFLKWKGWLEGWEGEPRFLDEGPPLPAGRAEGWLAKANVWISGDAGDRAAFLGTLQERGADWEITFTNCFQPGDDPGDFLFKAAWPNTAGYEAAQRLGGTFVNLRDLQAAAKEEMPGPREEVAPVKVAEPASVPIVESVAVQKPASHLWPALFGALAVLAFAAALFYSNRSRRQSTGVSPSLLPPRPARAQSVDGELDIVLPDKATWLAVIDANGAGQLGPIPPLKTLMGQLRGSEVFTKDLTCLMQTNLYTPGFAASLDSRPDENLLRCFVTNGPIVDLIVSREAFIETDYTNSFSVEFPGRFRILGIKNPIRLGRRFVAISTNAELRPDLAERVHKLELPKGSQFALRPLVGGRDPLAGLERDFSIIPSTVLDLQTVQAHVQRIVSDKEERLEKLRAEEGEVVAAQKEFVTKPPQAEEEKLNERLKILRLAIPKAAQELHALQARARAVPENLARIEQFALFLCLSNVNSEIVRFAEP